MNIFTLLKKQLLQSIASLLQEYQLNPDGILTDQIIKQIKIDLPKNSIHGQIYTNAPMLLSGNLGNSKVDKLNNPLKIAELLVPKLSQIDYIEQVSIAKPGFINIVLYPNIWYQSLADILNQGLQYAIGLLEEHERLKINLEYVSANPTGPMHIGHARGAVLGNSIANILERCGHHITREYYVNDYGAQIDDLVNSAFLRYKQLLDNKPITNIAYPGEYLIPLAETLLEKFSDSLLALDKEETFKKIKPIVIEEMLNLIKKDLNQLGVIHQHWTFQSELIENGKITEAVKILQDKNLIYHGILEEPKGTKTEDWNSREQLLFRSTKYGDISDRSLQRADGTWTYFASDISYAADKIARDYQVLVTILGSDHIGYVARMNAAIQALSADQVQSKIILSQIVNYVENGEPIKMSKRAGKFTTLRDVVDLIDPDIIRFVMLTRKSESILDFDLIKAQEQSKDNVVFYIQYSHVRCISLVNKCKERLPQAYEDFIVQDYDLSMLKLKEEMNLIIFLSTWPKTLLYAAESYDPHQIFLYIEKLATAFHELWNLSGPEGSYHFIIESNPALTKSRIALAKAVQIILNIGLEIMGVKPLLYM